MSRSALSWFYTLDLKVQVALLARPHGYLAEAVAAAIPKRSGRVPHDDRPQRRRRWQLRSAEAIALENERLRLDSWWSDLADETRTALLGHRAGKIPARYREAILDLDPDAVPARVGAETPFALSGIAAAYVEMVADGADPR